MKEAITSTFILHHFDRNRDFILKIDFFDYVNEDVLSQYDDEEILHLVTFYNKNMNSTKCNYEIYDKKLLIIIRCLKLLRFKNFNDEIIIVMKSCSTKSRVNTIIIDLTSEANNIAHELNKRALLVDSFNEQMSKARRLDK